MIFLYKPSIPIDGNPHILGVYPLRQPLDPGARSENPVNPVESNFPHTGLEGLEEGTPEKFQGWDIVDLCGWMWIIALYCVKLSDCSMIYSYSISIYQIMNLHWGCFVALGLPHYTSIPPFMEKIHIPPLFELLPHEMAGKGLQTIVKGCLHTTIGDNHW